MIVALFCVLLALALLVDNLRVARILRRRDARVRDLEAEVAALVEAMTASSLGPTPYRSAPPTPVARCGILHMLRGVVHCCVRDRYHDDHHASTGAAWPRTYCPAIHPTEHRLCRLEFGHAGRAHACQARSGGVHATVEWPSTEVLCCVPGYLTPGEEHNCGLPWGHQGCHRDENAAWGASFTVTYRARCSVQGAGSRCDLESEHVGSHRFAVVPAPAPVPLSPDAEAIRDLNRALIGGTMGVAPGGLPVVEPFESCDVCHEPRGICRCGDVSSEGYDADR